MMLKTRIQYEDKTHHDLGLPTKIIWKDAVINLDNVAAIVHVTGEEESDCAVQMAGGSYLVEIPYAELEVLFLHGYKED